MDNLLKREVEVLRGLSPARKLAIMHGLIRQAYYLKAAWLRASAPELSEDEIRARVREVMGGGGT